jgi:hypothetical protein
MTTRVSRFALLAALACGPATVAAQDSWRVNFDYSIQLSFNPEVPPHSVYSLGPGVIGGSSDRWNHEEGNGYWFPPGIALFDQDGAYTPFSYAWWGQGSYSHYDGSLTGKFDKLLSTVIRVSNAEIRGLEPDGIYDFYLYSGGQTFHTVNGQLFSIQGGSSIDVNDFSPGVYYDFHTVAADADGKLTILATELASQGLWGFSSWQLTPHAVPEPGSAAFAVTLFALRCAFDRRRRITVAG